MARDQIPHRVSAAEEFGFLHPAEQQPVAMSAWARRHYKPGECFAPYSSHFRTRAQQIFAFPKQTAKLKNTRRSRSPLDRSFVPLPKRFLFDSQEFHRPALNRTRRCEAVSEPIRYLFDSREI